MTYEEIKKMLDSPIPRSEVLTRDGGGGIKLDYVSSYYVIKNLNELIGQGNWSYDIKELKHVYSGKAEDRYGKEKHIQAYTALVVFKYSISDKEAYYCDVGYGDGNDKMESKSHELAVKEAVTDALKRCAKNLGMRMGLALYSKEQEFVSDEEEVVKEAPVQKLVDIANLKTKEDHIAFMKIFVTRAESIDGNVRVSASDVVKKLKDEFKFKKIDMVDIDTLKSIVSYSIVAWNHKPIYEGELNEQSK